MIKIVKYLSIFSAVLMVSSCNLNNNDTDDIGYAELHYTFATDDNDWVAGFADYPKVDEANYELLFEHTALPTVLNLDRKSLKLSGNNHSDDLFMYVKRKIVGLEPNKSYFLTFNIKFASNVADNMVGIGGSPGESVYLKAGATTIEPLGVEDASGDIRMNIDKGNQSQSGDDMVVLGDFSNDSEENEYKFKSVYNNIPLKVTSNDDGEVWIIVGTDSGFEGVTTIYYSVISLIFVW